MKKLNLLIAIAMLAALLLAAVPSGKLVRLQVINKTDQPVYLKLEGKETDAFYYLTIAADDDVTFTVVSDVYKRTTWTCDGVKSSGELAMTGNVRLVFTPCGKIPLRKVWRYYWYDWDSDGFGGGGPLDVDDTVVQVQYFMPNFGEPTQEKVFYFKEYSFVRWTKLTDPIVADGAADDIAGLYYFWWSPDFNSWYWVDWYGQYIDGHFTVWLPFKLGVAWRTYKAPVGQWWRYSY
ncbi:MAG: hypothetical protein AB1894_26765 [Chloroflexota bacterium]